ncbi:MAG: YerC/YecD family TrpR-related protein [Pseudomonadota bacterium]
MKPNRQLSQRQQKAVETSLSQAFAALGECSDVHALFKDLCTPAELQALADRWQVVQLLNQGLSYRAINDKTGVSVTTIGRVARYLSDGAGGYSVALQALGIAPGEHQ